MKILFGKKRYGIICFMLLVGGLSCNKNTSPSKIHLVNSDTVSITSLKLDALVDSLLQTDDIPGISMAVINGGKITYHTARGFSNLDTSARITKNSIFEAASLSKPIFAYFTLKLMEKGILDLDRPLFYYLDDPEMNIDPGFERVNARMVLSHSTGFPNWRWFDSIPENQQIERGDFFFVDDPGNFTYSGEAYQYLGRVLAHNNFINMFELAELFEHEVAHPLELKHAYFVWDDFLSDHKVFGHYEQKVKDRNWGSGLPHQHSKIMNPAAGLHTEAESYARFLMALLNEEGLYPLTFEEMFAVQIELPETHRFYQNEKTSAWGLGIAIEYHNGHTFYKHGGNNGDFTSGFLIDRTTKNGYVFFTNCEKGVDIDKAIRKLLVI